MTSKPIRILIAAIALLTLAGSTPAEQAGRQKHILILNSYHETFHWTDRIMSGIKSVMEPQSDVELFVTYMDTKRSSNMAYFKILRDMYALHYKHIPFDAIISTDDRALNFLLKYRNDLFPGVPVFFSGINDFHPSRIEGRTLYTGVYETYDVAGTIGLMLQIHPQTKRIVTITDHTVSGLAFLNHILRAKEEFSGQVRFEHLHNLPPEKMCEKLNELPPDALVLWALYTKTPAGTFISGEASLQMITKASPVPVYCIWDVVGHGVVGGRVTNPTFQGKAAAEMAMSYLRGSRIEDLPVSGSPMVDTFDYNVMQRWGIAERNLPIDSLILNRPFSVYQEYKATIWMIIGFLILLMIIILFLIYYILQKRQADKKLLVAQEQLAQSRKMEALGQLAGGVAHDFNNMLAGIAGATELLETDVTPQNHKFIELILSLVNRASQLTGKLLAFGRHSSFILQPTDLHRTIESCIDILNLGLNKAVTIEAQLQADHFIVNADESQVINAFLNLGINAEHAMPDGGSLVFKTSTVTLDQAFCNTAEFNLSPGRYFCAEICDTGTGIKPEHLSKIFEPFFSTNELGHGTGLGLASVYSAVIEHRGAITVHSEIDKGTIFTIYLPSIDAAASPSALGLQNSRGNGEMILVAEDEELMRNTTVNMLTDLNYRVITAVNGKEATDTFKEHAEEIKLTIMDVIMPEMSGRKAAEHIRGINGKAKIIFVSGFTGEEAFGEELQNSYTAFLEKPYRKEKMSQIIASMLQDNSESSSAAQET